MNLTPVPIRIGDSTQHTIAYLRNCHLHKEHFGVKKKIFLRDSLTTELEENNLLVVRERSN